jgi:hypothetical protein
MAISPDYPLHATKKTFHTACVSTISRVLLVVEIAIG